jgi:spore germination protein YaaH
MIKVCKKFHYAGIQIDFEHILFSDKNAFTHFYQKVSTALHKNGFLCSVAILPRTTDKIPTSNAGKYCLEYWNGAYDYAALGKASNFVTLMAYDQHSNGTTPGSACEPNWAKRIIVYALKYIAPSKISLGIPVHSSYWFTDFGTNSKHVAEADLTYPQMRYVAKKFHAQFVWDKKRDVPYAIFTSHHLNNYIFPQNEATFKILFRLAKKYHLRGVSLWCLGYEDPNIWKVIAAH